MYLHPVPRLPGGFRVESGRARWATGHIPGAGFVDLPEELSDRASPLRFMMPAAQFADAMSRHGVGDGVRGCSTIASSTCTHAYLLADVLRRKLETVGVLGGRVITYSGSGIAASSDAFALSLLGHDNVAVYDASLSEWAADPALPMEQG